MWSWNLILVYIFLCVGKMQSLQDLLREFSCLPEGKQMNKHLAKPPPFYDQALRLLLLIQNWMILS